MMLGHHGKDPTRPVAKSTAGPTRQTSRTDTNMRLKLYRAANMAAAMDAVRAELGGEALILNSRRMKDGVEVTAGVDAAPVAVVAPAMVVTPDSARPARLQWHGVPAALVAKLQQGPLPFALQLALRFTGLDLAPQAPPLMCVGPPGAGKTLAVVRLATRLVLAGQTPLIVTTDGNRAGAVEQLQAFTRLLGLDLVVADDAAAVSLALQARAGPVLIDTAGCDPFDPADHAELADIAGHARARMALVLPAGLDPQESQDIGAAFAAAGASVLIATKTDLARRLGGVLAAAGCGLALTEAGIGAGAADGLTALTPAWLADRLMQRRSGANPK